MKKEDIIRMARVAGCHDNGEEFRFVELHYLERFAALVAAAERAACAECVEEMAVQHPKHIAAAIRARGQQ